MSRLLKTKDKTILKLDRPVVVLDLATNALFALNAIKKMLPYENILHISDFEKDSYEAHDADVPLDISAIVESVKKLIGRALKYNPKLIICASDAIIEYGKEILDGINIPHVYITDVIIDEINKNFEYKNMAFFATQGIIEANLYQKNFHYTRLYNLNADNILNIINNFKMKTSESFNEIKIALFPMYKKDVDVIIPSIPNILLFKTEIFEYTLEQNKDLIILPVDYLLAECAKNILSDNKNSKKRAKGCVYIVKKLDKNNKNIKEIKKAECDLRKSYNKALDVNFRFLYEEI